MTAEDTLRATYDAFNSRDIGTVLASMTDDVDWPNAWEGGRLIGKQAVRDYWMRQWAQIDPHVEPTSFQTLADGRMRVTVRQTVRTLDGDVLSRSVVSHDYRLRAGLVAHMEMGQA
jgi:ketosteroid isomerase-like protein